jgi:hypothetical protein
MSVLDAATLPLIPQLSHMAANDFANKSAPTGVHGYEQFHIHRL